MIPDLRDYQLSAYTESMQRVAEGKRRVCLVSPTGSGKTRMGVELARGFSLSSHPAGRGLWLAHRTELIAQAADKLKEAGLDVGLISPQFTPNPWAPVQVASFDTLVSRDQRPPADWVIVDEAHHLGAKTYANVLESYEGKIQLGLTATPQRRDGKALKHWFDALVIAANYSELLKAGHIVPCRVFRPDSHLGSDLAQDPLVAYQRLAAAVKGMPLTFAFAQNKTRCEEFAAEFLKAGIPAAALTDDTPKAARLEILAKFRSGAIRVLWNVYVLTEGVDIPAAQVCLLARGVSHAGPYLQMVGRVLRPWIGKLTAYLLDLSGASHLHGFPTADRDYSLDGRPITVIGEPLKNCPKCGATIPSAENPCKECGHWFERRDPKRPRIWDLELLEAIEAVGGDAQGVSEEHKEREWRRLYGLCKEREWSVAWAERQYRELFGSVPKWLGEIPVAERHAEWKRLRGVAEKKGYKRGWAAYRYKTMFGVFPHRDWT